MIAVRVLRSALACGTVLCAFALAVIHGQNAAPSNSLPQPYRTTRDWGQLPAGVKWAAVTAVEPAPDGSIFVIHRCQANSCAGRSEAPILKFDAAGRLLASWGSGMFVFPHGATVDREGNLWVTDARGENGKGQQVFKFSPSGQVLMTLGQAGVSGTGPGLFDQPTDVVVAANGDIFVTDSHRNGLNNRVVKFAKNGTFVKTWGRKGSGPGEFSEPHTIAIDSTGRLFVGDRENNRIQIFDQDGRFIDEWRQFGRPSGIFITSDDTVYVADSESGPDTGAHELTGIRKGIRIGSAKDGRVAAFIEDMESTSADHSGAEGVGVDAQGNVYGAVVRRQMLERHVRTSQASADAPFVLPAPTGRFPVGTTSWQLMDPSRREPFTGNQASRAVEVVAWYPAAAAAEPAPYLRWGLFEVQGFADLLRAGRHAYDHLDRVRTHASLDAEAAGGSAFPVVVFAAGYGGFAAAHTALFEDLASHGYAVLNVVHPYEVGAARVAGGRLVSFLDDTPGGGKPRQGYLAVVNEWGKEDDTMAAVTASTAEAEQRRLLREYFAATPNTGQAVRRWVDDTKFVLDRVSALPPDVAASAAGRLALRLDMARIAVGGHSMGGVVAGQFCVEDARCRAGMNLDGIPQFGDMIDKPLNRPFMMVYSARPGRLGASDVVYRRARPYYRVDVANTRHLDFSDMVFWGGPLRERNAYGSVTPERITAITRAVARQYFDQVLLGRASPILAGTIPFEEVTVRQP
jgi:predicted dienelactone hydrolase/sugar lactone lactonase YvrE